MSMQQTAADGDPKTGSSDGSSGDSTEKPSLTSGRGIFIFERESVVMRKWQILEFDGKPYYAFVPDEEEVPLDINELPEYGDDVSFEVTGTDEEAEQAKENADVDIRVKEEQRAQARTLDASIDENSMDDQEGCFDYQELEEEEEEKEEEAQPEPADVKPVIVNGKATAQQQAGLEVKPEATDVKPPIGDLYQVKVQAGMVLLEKLDLAPIEAGQPLIQASGIRVSEVAIEDSSAKEHLQEVEDEGELREEAVAQEENPVARGALKCKVCSETFESSVAFKKHVAWTHKRKLCVQENGVYICSVCDYRTQKKSLFAAHLQNKHETWSQRRRSSSPVSFPCAACGFVCRSKHSLQSHFIRKHTDRYEHQCKFCTKKFKVKGDLTNHIRFHHKEKPVNCDVCGKLCMNSGSLYVHQKWAHYKPKYECPICKRRMVTQENLDQHMLMQHEKREKIVCAECGKTFSKKDSFKRHMAVHTGQKPYKCLICHKSFARRSQLRQHLLIHTGKRPFVCDICGKAFTQKPGLICHRKTHPGSHPPLPVMPIGDIVKEFTDGYLAGTLVAKKEEDDENPEEELEDEYDDEEEDEEYEEGMEEQEVLEEVILDEEMEMDKFD